MLASTPDPAATNPAARSRKAHRTGFWVAAVCFGIAMAFSTIPTPIYALYQQRDGYPAVIVTVVFAAYAVGVAISLYFVGHVSDWLGRRGVFIAALLVQIVSALMFIVWNDAVGLVVARFVSGIGIGVLTATATAYIGELRSASHPESRIGPAVANFANIGGLALGPLVAGLLVTFFPAPLTTPYAVLAVMMAAAVVATVAVPETVARHHRVYRPQRIAVPAGSRAAFWAAAIGAFTSFSVFGLAMALTPTVLVQAMGVTSHLAAGAVPFAVFMSAAVAQLATLRLSLRRQLIVSWVLMSAGIALIALSVGFGILWVFVLAGVAAGAGVGIMFRASLGVGGGLAPAGAKGEVLATMFLVGYLGLAVPVLLIGAALAFFPLAGVMVVFAVVVLALVAFATPRMLRRLAA